MAEASQTNGTHSSSTTSSQVVRARPTPRGDVFVEMVDGRVVVFNGRSKKKLLYTLKQPLHKPCNPVIQRVTITSGTPIYLIVPHPPVSASDHLSHIFLSQQSRVAPQAALGITPHDDVAVIIPGAVLTRAMLSLQAKRMLPDGLR